MSIKIAKPEHEVAYQDLCKLFSKHADKVDALEFLAIAANMLGKMIAMQDSRTVTKAMAMDVVAKNLEEGNKQVLHRLATTLVKGKA